MHVKAICTMALSALVIFGFNTTTSPSEFAKVTGTLTYPHIALPSDAVIYVSLVDVSPREDASADIIARQTINHRNQVPLPFELKYDPARIISNHIYAIQVHITAKNRLLLINTSAYPVITQGNPSTVKVILSPTNQ